MYNIRPGTPKPLGATIMDGGVNFSLYARHATAVRLLFFEHSHDEAETWYCDLEPETHRTYDYWHVFVEGAAGGLFYAYRLDGPWEIMEGHRYNWNKVIVDPYAHGYVTDYFSRAEARHKGDNIETAPKSVVIDLADYDWEGDRPLKRPLAETVIYEMHLRGFTRDPSAGVTHPGTYAGLIEKIPYLVDLGITAIELLPIHEFDQTDVVGINVVSRVPLLNYWGYTTIGFFAPESSYSYQWDTGQQVREFRDMVKALHRAGIEVILDVVYNHTTEGDERGPTLCYRGIDNSTYYILDEKGRYKNFSGCGNTLNTNHPVVRTMILDSLRYWVQEMHVDGFRFDLASILSRDEDGNPLKDPPILWEIESDPILQDTKLIAEAWDAGGLYQVGAFPGYRWAEWNGRYRDDIRALIKGDTGKVWDVANRIAGSHDIYAERYNLPQQSINFFCCHDGFTLNDLVSYNEKHNLFNGEDNRDGSNDNLSWNCGVEGPTSDPEIEVLRTRQIKNFVAVLMVSQGTPMLLAGDEMRRTQLGNNNAYCQDNQISWLDWTLLDEYADIHRFVRGMIHLRRAHPILRRPRHFHGETDPATGLIDIELHGVRLRQADYGSDSHSLAFTLAGLGIDNTFHVIINAFWKGLHFEIPKLPPGWEWLRVVDTGLASPDDLREPGEEVPVHARSYSAVPRSVIILMSHRAE